VNREKGFFSRLKQGLSRTREGWVRRLESVLERAGEEENWDDLEEVLITADIGMKAVQRLLASAQRADYAVRGDVKSLLRFEIVRMLGEIPRSPVPRYSQTPWVTLMVGVNGVGKTTTIGKLAHQLGTDGRKVILAAADTFRAGAIEQLDVWGKRAGAEVVKHGPGQDPSGVVFDAVHAAQKRKADVLIIDTAGRLHTKVNLVEELKKMHRVLGKENEGAPHETLLVIDANTGQNAITQARIFKESVGVTGIVLTKLDGTAKGGVVLAIQQELEIPVQYVGVGEGVDDLQEFDPESFVRALFE
jgi:fused signal recognition particle receptor